MARALAAAIAVSLLAVAGAGGSGAATPKRGGTVHMSGGSEPACITPYIMACAGGALVTTLDYLPRVVLPGAYEVRPDLTWQAQLISHVDVSAQRLLTLTYHIRPKARWSDGVPVSAADFVFTYQTMVKYKAQLEPLDQMVVGMIQSVRVLDGKTVRVVLPLDVTAWRGHLFYIVLPRHVLEGEDYPSVWRERIENPRTGEPIGSGPFLVSSWKRGKQLTLARNRRYWGSHVAYADRVVVRFGLTGKPSRWLASGAVDVAPSLGPETIPSLRRVPGVRVVSRLAPAIEHIWINVGTGGHPLLRQRFVRQALAYGVDRRAIVQTLYGKALPQQHATDNAFYLNSSPYYRATWGYRYRPVESRRLLRTGGCVRGTDGIFVCDGQRLSLRFVTRGDVPMRVRTFGLVRSQLEAAGIEIVPEFGWGDAVVNAAWATGDYDLLELTNIYWDPPDEYALTPLLCVEPPFGLAWTRYCQQRDAAAVSRANHTLVGRERARVVNEIGTALAKEVPVLLLYWRPAIAASSSSLRGYVLHPLDPFWRAEEWWFDHDR